MKADLETTLKLIAAQATALRDAGVTAISVGDVSIELAPRDQPEPAAKGANNELEQVIKAAEQQERRGPLHDPDLFPRGRVPGRQRFGDDDDS